jgi:hypothetical protein
MRRCRSRPSSEDRDHRLCRGSGCGPRRQSAYAKGPGDRCCGAGSAAPLEICSMTMRASSSRGRSPIILPTATTFQTCAV